jgi:adenine-specific DNA methylase
MEKIGQLKLTNNMSMTDFLNKHRQYKADMKEADGTYSDSQMVSNILTGLPASYTDFKKQYNWIRARDLNQTPDLDFLFNRLFMEEEDQDKSKATRTRKTNNGKHDKPDKSHLKCTHSDCGRTGHEEKDCWVAHPEKMPPKLKEKLDKRKAGGSPRTTRPTRSAKPRPTNRRVWSR